MEFRRSSGASVVSIAFTFSPSRILLRRSSTGAVSTSFLDRIVDDKPRKAGIRTRRPLGNRERRSEKSVAELDAELESYMNKGRPLDL